MFKKGNKINKLLAIRKYNKIKYKYNCDIYPTVILGDNAYIAHAHNILIGRTAIIGNNCRIYPNVSIVAAVKGDEERNKNKQRRHAKIGNNCIIGNGAIIIGPINVGDDVTIGAGSIITKDIPSHSVVKNVNEIRSKKLEEISKE